MNNYSRYTYKGKTKQGKWVYGNLLEPKRMYAFNEIDRSNKFCLIVECSFANGGWVRVGTKHCVLKETLCQCTGLQDRDGNYIFENDIISSNANLGYGKRQKKVEIISQVIYLILNEKTMSGLDTNQCSMFTTKQLNKEQEYTNMDWSVFFNCKVIGNKFDKEVE